MAKSAEEKKQAQHEAYRRWYLSEKGKAYRDSYKQRHKELKAKREEKVEEPA